MMMMMKKGRGRKEDSFTQKVRNAESTVASGNPVCVGISYHYYLHVAQSRTIWDWANGPSSAHIVLC